MLFLKDSDVQQIDIKCLHQKASQVDWVGQMAQQVRIPAVLLEDLSSVCSIHIGWLLILIQGFGLPLLASVGTTPLP